MKFFPSIPETAVDRNDAVVRFSGAQTLALILVLVAFGCTPCYGAVEQSDNSSIMIRAWKYYTGRNEPVDYGRALQLYLQAAEQGNPEAQFIVGGMYYRGQGTDPNPVEAFTWLLRAERNGRFSAESLALIGTMYLQGVGVPQNYTEAEKYLRRAAELGDIKAKKNLAYLLYNGLGRAPDYEQALSLYTEVALSGDDRAQYNVGVMHENGLGTEPDTVTAYGWYSLAASRGNTGAVAARNRLTARMGFEDLNRAQQKALELFEKVAGIAGKGQPLNSDKNSDKKQGG